MCTYENKILDYISFYIRPVAEHPAGLSLHTASATKTPIGEIPSPTANWDTSELHLWAAGTAAFALNTQQLGFCVFLY